MSVEAFDHQHCAALHNSIVEAGWSQRGFRLQSLDKRSWWECYGGDGALASISDRLDVSLIRFLQAAWHGFAMESAAVPHLFHRYLARLCSPDELWQNINYADNEDDSNKRRFVSLYMANWALGADHPLGLVLDQEEGTAMQHMSINDTSITMNRRQIWLPLDTILEGLSDMIGQEKVVATDDTYNGTQERTVPWIMPSYTELDLEDTVHAWQHLMDAISTKMPTQPQLTEQNLLEIVVGNTPQSLPSNSFAYRFLSQAARPPFAYIAPGLSIARYHPFDSMQVVPGKLRPLLLFTSTHVAHQEIHQTPWTQAMFISPFAPDFHAVDTYPAGMYLTETNPRGQHPFEDGCELLLPFTLGANGYARTSDGALIGEDLRREGEDAPADTQPKSTELFQLGYNHFIASHDVQLKYVLWKWAEMVEDGKWEVDHDGVVGGIEKWKEADTQEYWGDYQLPMSW